MPVSTQNACNRTSRHRQQLGLPIEVGPPGITGRSRDRRAPADVHQPFARFVLVMSAGCLARASSICDGVDFLSLNPLPGPR